MASTQHMLCFGASGSGGQGSQMSSHTPAFMCRGCTARHAAVLSGLASFLPSSVARQQIGLCALCVLPGAGTLMPHLPAVAYVPGFRVVWRD
jgi:hypothetical protein